MKYNYSYKTFHYRVVFVVIFSFFLFLTSYTAANASQTKYYQATQKSLSLHPVPDWYQDAKFGIMIHYGLYSVPGWAPVWDPKGKLFTKEFFINNPYVAWYQNSMQIKDSPTYQYHLKTYGANFTYDDFIPKFNEAAQHFNADSWSSLFQQAGAKYVVFVTKHHDGFLLWPSEYKNPYKNDYYAARNIVSEVVTSTRKYGMRVGLYYSGGYDWSWPSKQQGPITDGDSAVAKLPQSQEYADYVEHQWRELITLYHPDLLWNDIALPTNIDEWQLLADFYNQIPDGVINHRWSQNIFNLTSLLGQPSDSILNYQLSSDWFDYYSTEYLDHYETTLHKWEADRAPGFSFEYNRNEYEHPEHFFTVDQLIACLADIVSKNGNLLLGIGPMADGTIPELERNLLLGLGQWLNKNGEAIYATRPWLRAEGTANHGIIPVRYTLSKDAKSLYVILLSNPKGQDVLLQDILLGHNSQVEILNGNEPINVSWLQTGGNVLVFTSRNQDIPLEHPLVVKITFSK